MNCKPDSELKDFYVFKPNSNNIENILIILHGYGASKEDLKDIVPSFNKLQENTAFFIPNAPFHCDAGFGYQWFPIEFNDSGLKMDINDCKQALQILTSFIGKISNEYNIPFNKISIFGFSQGAVMALCLALFSQQKFASIVAHSGLFFNYDGDIEKIGLPVNKEQNILLIHGKEDDVVPFVLSETTMEFFNECKIPFSTFFKDDLAHHVDEETLEQAQNFFKKHY